MAKAKQPAKPKETKYPRNDFQFDQGETDKETYANVAKFIASPELAAGRVISAAERTSGVENCLDIPSIVNEIKHQAHAIQNGDMKQAEAMLANQALALQTLFARLTEKALGSEYMHHMDGYLKLALRAQNQSRTTLEALSAIKNPPIVYAKQANFAHGHQQVNNGVEPPPRTRKSENQPNQLLEEDNGKWMDTRAKGQTSCHDSCMETLATVDRPKNRRR